MPTPHFALDMARSRPRPSWMAWLLAALALALFAGAVAWTLPAWHRRAQARAELDQWHARQARQAPPVARATTPAEQRLAVEMGRIASDLNRPWSALFDALDASARPSVQLVQLSVDGAFTRLQLQVQARGLGEVMQYLRVLEAADAPAPFRRAELSSHEAAPADAATPLPLQARLTVPLLPVHTPPVESAASAVPWRLACGRAGERGSVPCNEGAK